VWPDIATCIGEGIRVGGNCHGRFAILLFFSYEFEILCAKSEGQEFVDGTLLPTPLTLLSG
jgi:hypothetical protein